MRLPLLQHLNEEAAELSLSKPYGGESKFISSSDVYFRGYEIPEEGFYTEDKTVLFGKTSLEEKTGAPEDYAEGSDEEPEFYTYYTYAIFEDIE